MQKETFWADNDVQKANRYIVSYCNVINRMKINAQQQQLVPHTASYIVMHCMLS